MMSLNLSEVIFLDLGGEINHFYLQGILYIDSTLPAESKLNIIKGFMDTTDEATSLGYSGNQRLLEITNPDRLYCALKDIATRRGIVMMDSQPIPKKIDRALHGLYFKLDDQSYIVINPNRSREVMAETLAHELGHFMLHRDNLNGVLYNSDRGYREFKEVEANCFAIRLIHFLSHKLQGGF